MLSFKSPGNPVLSKGSSLFEAVMEESSNPDSPKEKRKLDVKSHSLSHIEYNAILDIQPQEGQHDTHIDI